MFYFCSKCQRHTLVEHRYKVKSGDTRIVRYCVTVDCKTRNHAKTIVHK